MITGKLKKTDPYILAFGLLAASAFVLTAVLYGLHFFPYMPMHSDANGYYMYLPAVFVYRDPGMHFLHLLTPDPSGFENTFFLIPDTGQVVDKYTMGVAVLQMPFFLVAHGLTLLFRPALADGYSSFYQLANIASGCFWFFVGSVCTLKVGEKYASKKSIFVSVLLVTFGTGLFYYLTRDGGYSHVYSYACIALFMLLIQRYEEKPSLRLQLLGGLIFGMLTLVRVTNVVMVMLFVCFGTTSVKRFFERLIYILRPDRWIGILVGFLIPWIPQLAYWKWAAGSFIVNSYNLPGNEFEEVFYWTSPKILEVLFLPNRGIFFWGPVLVFSAVGLWMGLRKKKELWPGMLISALLFTYITACWWCYDGLCGFTNRFFVDLSAFFILWMALFWDEAKKHRGLLIACGVFAAAGLVWTNLFMVEYWFHETTKFNVHWEEIRQVFAWYRLLIQNLL